MRDESLVRDSIYMRTRGINVHKDERVRGEATDLTAPVLFDVERLDKPGR